MGNREAAEFEAKWVSNIRLVERTRREDDDLLERLGIREDEEAEIALLVELGLV